MPPSTDHQRAAAKRPRRRDPALLEARAELVVMRRLAGADIETIAQEFGVSRTTIYDAIDYAKKHDLFERARGFIVQGLMPKALLVYDKALDAGDLDAARDVMQGLALLPKAAVAPMPDPSGGEGGETLEIWRERVAVRRHAAAGALSAPGAGAGDGAGTPPAIDAEATPVPDENPGA
jgi:AcrR family transcriptional regulator